MTNIRKNLILILLVVIAMKLAYISNRHWYPHVHAHSQRYALITPFDQLQQQVDLLKEQNLKLQIRQRILQNTIQSSTLQNDSWVLADAGYLVRLANYQLTINHDADVTVKLLKTADERLAGLRNPQYQPARQALANNILQLQAIPRVDKDGIIAQLNALSAETQHLTLVIPNITPAEPAPVEHRYPHQWQNILASLWRDFRSLIVVRHLDHSLRPLLTNDQRVSLNQHMMALLQQAQWGVLYHDDKVYQLSLSNAIAMVTEYFVVDQTATTAVLNNLKQLQKINVAPAYPDISQTVNLLAQLDIKDNTRKL